MRFFEPITGVQRLFITVLVLATVAVLLAYGSSGPLASLVTGAVILGILGITRGIWLPPGAGNTRVRLFSLVVVLAAASTSPFWAPVANAFVRGLQADSDLVARFPALGHLRLIGEQPSVAVLLFVAVCVLGINYFMRDSSISGAALEGAEKTFPERDYSDRFASFCDVLRRSIDDIDRESNWSPEYYTPLEAEVTASKPGEQGRSVADLQSAIRHNKSARSFLVLGEPGSGKSVALRKLTLAMLAEAKSTKRVPVYVNLREWTTRRKWTREDPPTVHDLLGFVIINLKHRGDVYFEEFIDKYFHRMVDHGRVFFLLDSFDEIPQALDESEDSWLIDSISEVLSKFVLGAHGSRGLLSSRFFRQPTSRFNCDLRLEIRPLTEEKVGRLLQRYTAVTNEHLGQLFSERPDLVPVATNPFTANLLGSWIQDSGVLPPSQVAIYFHYVERQLARCSRFAEERGIDLTQVPPTCGQIAAVTYSTQESGLEVAIDVLNTRLGDTHPISKIVDLLVYARLGRRIGAADDRFTFVHRRFTEFFVVQHVTRTGQRPSLESIPADSKWRDALVLYVEIAPDEECLEIAQFCWTVIADSFGRASAPVDGIHCLRFLVDAFRTKRHLLTPYVERLEALIAESLLPTANTIRAKVALEATGLTTPWAGDAAIASALKLKNWWLSEAALRACRFLPRFSNELSIALENYFDRMPATEVLRRGRELNFALSLAPPLQPVRAFFKLRFTQVLFQFAAIGIASAVLVITAFGVSWWSICMAAMATGTSLAGAWWCFERPRVATFDFQLRQVLIPALLFSGLITLISPYTQREMPKTHLGTFLRDFTGFDFASWAAASGAQSRTTQLASMVFFIPWFPLGLVRFCRRVILYAANSEWRQAVHEVKAALDKLPARRLIFATAPMLAVLAVFSIPGADYYLMLVAASILSVLPLILMAMGALVALTWVRLWVHDKKILKKTGAPRGEVTRAHIALTLAALKTTWGRNRYLSIVEALAVSPGGEWPDKSLLTISTDPVSIRLAQLEERWLGLNR